MVFNMQKLNNIIESLSVEEMVGQLLNFNCTVGTDINEFKRIVKRVRPGGIFVHAQTNKETIDEYTSIVNKCSKVPVIIAADVENGPGWAIKGESYLPSPMAWGACDDEKLIESAGKVTGEICRKNGVHLSFAPVVDINYNKDNPVVNNRAVSDSPKQVAKIAGAYVKGMQANGMMVSCCKHFPGDGMDDRNQHFCTTINTFSKEEWLNTYGYVYKKMFECGVASVMVAHIALPSVEDYVDPVLGPRPSTLSYKIITKLLKEELGFEGCVVSDAMTMVGASVMCPPERLSIEFIKAGGDMVLFPLERDYDYVLKAVKSGEISMERLKDAVSRVLKLKMQARLFEDQEKLCREITLSADIKDISESIGEKSVTVIKNTQNLIPLSIKKGGKFLIINLQIESISRFAEDVSALSAELEKRGYIVDSLKASEVNHHELEKIKGDYDCILITGRFDPWTHPGGTLRIGWGNVMPFWRGVVVDHPCVIFVSFGDPYKLYEFPFLRTYVNAYSPTLETVRAFAKVLLGEKPIAGKSPVKLNGYFERDVE